MKTRLGIAWFLLLTVLPLVLGMGYALLYSLGLAGILGEGLTLRYWEAVLQDREIWASLGYSLYIATVSMGLAIGLAIALLLRMRTSFRSGLLAYVIYFPLAIPAMVAAFISFQLLGKAGLFSRLAYFLQLTGSIEQFPDLVNDAPGMGIVFSHALLAFPFLLLLFLATYEGERLAELGQVARSLGASQRLVNTRVVIPILLRKNFASLVLYYIFVLGSYEIPLLLGRESPQMVSVLTIRKLQRYDLMDKPEAYLIALVYTLFVLAAMVWVFRQNEKR